MPCPQLTLALTVALHSHRHPRQAARRTLPDGAVFVPYSGGWPALGWPGHRFVLPPPVAEVPGPSAAGLHPFTPPGFAPPLSPFTPVTQPHLESVTQRDRQLEPANLCFAPPGQPDLLQQQPQPPTDPGVLTLLASGYSPWTDMLHADTSGAPANAALHVARAVGESEDYGAAPQPFMEPAAAWVPVTVPEPLPAGAVPQQEDGLMRWHFQLRQPLRPMPLSSAAVAVQDPLDCIARLDTMAGPAPALVPHHVEVNDGAAKSPLHRGPECPKPGFADAACGSCKFCLRRLRPAQCMSRSRDPAPTRAWFAADRCHAAPPCFKLRRMCCSPGTPPQSCSRRGGTNAVSAGRAGRRGRAANRLRFPNPVAAARDGHRTPRHGAGCGLPPKLAARP